MNKKRKIIDGILNSLTYLSSAVSLLVLFAVFLFAFTKGAPLVNMDLITGDYWSKNYLVEPNVDVVATPQEFERPADLAEEVYWSSAWGIGLVDTMSREKQQLVLVEYVAEDSVFSSMVDSSAGENEGNFVEISAGLELQKLDYTSKDGYADFTGMLTKETASQIVTKLDSNVESIDSMYLKTAGGGISGSIKSTLYLMVISLFIAIPIGISAAIYLNEYGSKNKFNNLIRSGIETLTGVPSIIYGLMGVTVLFPITQAFGATTTNILLGGLTLAIILLPTIIRSTETALMNVPKELRDGSLSVGANQTQTIFKVVLPSAISGIITGVLLSVGRIIGESAALIYTMGTFINDDPTVLSQGTSLAVHIWSVMSGEQPNFELAAAISLVILVFVLCLNIAVKIVMKKFSKAV